MERINDIFRQPGVNRLREPRSRMEPVLPDDARIPPVDAWEDGQPYGDWEDDESVVDTLPVEADLHLPTRNRRNLWLLPCPPSPGQFSRADLQTRRESCPLCHGAGYTRMDVPVGHPQFGKPIPCQCKRKEQKTRRQQQLAALSGLDTASATFETYDPFLPGVEEAYNACQHYSEDPRGWLVLVGPNGCGKTHLALSIAQVRLQQGDVVLFQVVEDLLDHLRAAFAPTASEAYSEVFERMRSADVLILDDMGAEQATSWVKAKLFQLLNFRYNAMLPTIITTNMPIDAFEPRIRSRLCDRRRVRLIEMDTAKDYRPMDND